MNPEAAAGQVSAVLFEGASEPLARSEFAEFLFS
jgi:hypothetical protein